MRELFTESVDIERFRRRRVEGLDDDATMAEFASARSSRWL